MRLRVLLSFVAATALAAAAFATTVIPPSFGELVSEADRVFLGEVVDTSSAWTTRGRDRVITTTVVLRAVRTVKGTVGEMTTLEFLGGTVGDDTMDVVGMPRFRVGERDVFFVRPGQNRASPLVRMMHGRVRVMVEPDTGRQVVAAHDGEPVTSVESFGRAARARETTGRRRALSVDEFLEAVAARAAR